MPYACIFVPDFPVEALLRAEPELRSQAVAVLEGKPPLQKVFAVNEKARRLGIDPGMTKIQVEPCTELVLRPRSPLQETAAHAALLDCAQSFSPRVEDTAPDTVLLDLSGLESLFGSLPEIARDIARRTSDLGLEANVATAFNPDTARFAARGFAGVTVVPEGKEAERLGNLPLEVLFTELISPNPTEEAVRLLETFDLWGVRNLRALCALPEIALSERLGQAGVRLQQFARGAISRTLVPVDPPLIFEEAMELDHPLVLLEPLAFLLAHMLDQVCARLAARALAAQELRLRLELDTGFHFVEDLPNATTHVRTGALGSLQRAESRGPGRAPVRQQNAADIALELTLMHSSKFIRTLQLPVPMLDPKVFLKLLQLDLKAHPPDAPILKVHLSAIPAQPRTIQGGLFLPPTPDPEKLELTLARIAGMVGEDKVGSLHLLDSHRPEAFRMQRFVPTEAEGQKEKPDDVSSAPVTALRMFRPPLRATVTLREGKPAHVVCSKRKEVQGEILWMAGPWRSSGDWWEQDGWARDEWDIAIQTPVVSRRSSVVSNALSLYRLVHDLLSGGWFVEGTYD
ncbi:MAG TPA: DNA polymerase Y family protein [Terriglobales bacterium]|nr:DNA polymerase Y family protein [Terriglobales bacterium]